MDINSLLSPTESSANDSRLNSPSRNASPTTSASAARPGNAQRMSSGLSQQLAPADITSSPSPSLGGQHVPRAQQTSHSPSPLHTSTRAGGHAPHHPYLARASQAAMARKSPSLTSHPGSAVATPAAETQSPTLSHAHDRMQTSTPQMDTLADLAAMQQQNARKSVSHASPALTEAEIRTAQITGVHSRPLVSRNATDGSASSGQPNAARSFSTQALSMEDVEQLNQAAATLQSSALNYQAHIRMINLLHKGLLSHMDSEQSRGKDGKDYELLADLRQAREAMDSIYPLDEDLWNEWITDERALASTVEDRIAVMNLCTKAVTDEPSSAKLWYQYGDYMYDLYAAAHALSTSEGRWSEEEQLVGREVFTWTSVNDVWEQAVLATQWRMNDSNSIWDRYMEILQSEQQRKGKEAPFKIEQLQQLFVGRLTQPHATWENTFQHFSMFVSQHAPQDIYEDTMSKAAARGSQAKQMWNLRDMFELKISQAERAGDKDAEWEAYSEYLTWEVTKKGVFSSHLIVALYERAVTRFSAEATLWEDYIEYLLQDKSANVNSLHVLERATRHCPWSGILWSHRLVALEAAGNNFEEMEMVKHKATRTGILELAGIEELLKVYIAWCGFLRRRAFIDDSNDEDDLDIAEVGIRSGLEHVTAVAERLYGKDQWQGDPQYRLERIHIKFFTQRGDAEAARKIWRSIVPAQRNNYDFWYRWYIWEMIVWAKFAMRGNDPEDHELRNPTETTAVLKQALANVETMDSPEQLVQMFLSHCEQHESVQELQNAFILTRKLNKQIYNRRKQEHEAQLAQQRAQYEQQSLMEVVQSTSAGDVDSALDVATTESHGDASYTNENGKRKAEVEDHAPSKKSRTTEPAAYQSVDAQPKRDREHTTILVQKLPVDTTQTAIRKFFRDSGNVINIKINDEPDGTKNATVEFETAEDAQFALTRSTRPFEGHEIEITYACGSTLWVSNYPPEADQKYVRGLFEKFGEVVDVRFPSLKFNTHRRFCYVQFATPSEALAATSLNGTTLESNDQTSNDTYELIAKISAPEKKSEREGALQEGREVFVGQLSWYASEAELREVFGECGTVERVRIPKNVAGKSKGAAFVTFSIPEEAQQAVNKLQGHEIRGRAVTLDIAKPNVGGPKRTATSIVTGRGRSQTPSANGDVHMNGNAASPSASHASDGAAAATGSTATGENRKDRTLYLINIPDIVNDTRVRAFLEQFGSLKKLILRPDHQGAIAEFTTVADTGKAEMKIPDAQFDFEEGTGRFVTAVDEAQFFKTREEFRSDKLSKPTKQTFNGSASKPAQLMSTTRISRPGQAGGRRGGLGMKRGGVGLSGPRATNDGHGATADGSKEPAGAEEKGKSNDDFRAMLTGGK